MDHVVKVGQSPSPGGGWGGAPLPPHMVQNNNDYSPNHMQMQTPPANGWLWARASSRTRSLRRRPADFLRIICWDKAASGSCTKAFYLAEKRWRLRASRTVVGRESESSRPKSKSSAVCIIGTLCPSSDTALPARRECLSMSLFPNQTLEFTFMEKGGRLWTGDLGFVLPWDQPRGWLTYMKIVADFGLAKLTTDNYTHVSTRIMGTFGYLAPEYAASGKLTEKSDVFSFGVMLLELITGRRPVDTSNRTMEDSLVDWARPVISKAMEDGNYSKLVDPRLEDNYVPEEMARMVACASASIRHSARRRPRMSQIVRALEGDSSLEDLNESREARTKRALANSNSNVTNSNVKARTTHEIYDTGAYNADMMRFRQMIMPTQEYNSNDFGATSKYGRNPSSSSEDSIETGRTPNKKL
ncbi:Proline-rich receptor-like protein kinase PERK5 [Sesamum alatum]|uniref:non-specific serine/threonine protein kinase n=1 Tax=Sesamum alatum TaxID=300844 RepID=A0AAE2CBY8_9LAMI|nr:Proline-rich receptor-like protein kinase PERK5 [Sesamum alatum]